MTAQTVLLNIWKQLTAFESPGFYLAICTVAFFLILFLGKKRGRVAFVYPLILFLLVLLSPDVYHQIQKKQTDFGSADIGMMIVSAVPFALIAAVGIASLCTKFSKKILRMIAAAAFIVLLVLTGAPAVTDLSYYNVSAETIAGKSEGSAIADLIADNLDADTADVYVEDEDLASLIRTENASLFCTIGDKEEGLTKKRAKDTEADFFVVETGGKSDQTLSSSYTPIGKSSHYTVYKK